MEEWKEYKIFEVIEEVSMGPFGSNIKVDNFIDSGVPVLNGSNLQSFKLNEDSFNYVSQEKADSLGKANASRGDVIITHRGTLGQIVYIPDNSKFEQYIISQSQFRLKLKKDLIRPDFFVYFFHTRLGQHRIMMNASQVGVPALARPTSTFKEVSVPVPPMEAQNKIMAILHSLDDKIEINRLINDNFFCQKLLEIIFIWMITSLINDNLEKQAKALFKSWFVDFNPFKDGEFVESELGMIPKGWRAGTLSEIANITMGTSPSGASYNVNGEGEVFYQGRAEFGYRFPHRNMYTTEPKRYAEDGDVLLSVRAPVGDVNIANERCCIGRGLAAIGSESCPSYILYLVKSLKSVFEQYNGEGTVFGSINKKTLEGLRIIVPESKYIERFEKVANPLDGQIRCKEEESRRLASLRDTLLPKLMSGELKLNEVNV